MEKGNKHNKGFTLVEIIVVISIIGILAVTAIPILFNNIEKAYISKLILDYNAFKKSSLIYYFENDETIEDGFGYDDIKEGMSDISKITPIGGNYDIKGNATYKNAKYPNYDGSGIEDTNNEVHWIISLEIEGNDVNITQKQFKQLVQSLGKDNIIIENNSKLCLKLK